MGKEGFLGPRNYIRLVYYNLLKFKGKIDHGAKIFVDSVGTYLVKVEDHPSIDEPNLMVNYQGDHYMGV